MSLQGAPVIIPAQTGVAFALHGGEVVRILAVAGEQVADVALFDASDRRDSFSPGRTMDYNQSTRLGVGTALYSNGSVELATVVEDTVGVHDMLLAPCSERMFARRGQDGHASCHANLSGALRAFGIGGDVVTATVNVFMDVRIDRDGSIAIHPPPAKRRDVFALRAARDLIVAVAACSSELTNNGACKPVGYELATP